ncbi:MAG: ATP-binding protein [Chlorobiota bacterium]
MIKSITLTTDKDTLIKAEEFLSDFRSEYLLEFEERFMNLLIAYTEAVNNAVIHGNQQNPYKNVFIELEKSKNKLRITVADEGSGFSESKVPDPTLSENLLKQSGRGVFLIKKLTDEVSFKSQISGTKIDMIFYL